MDESTGPLCFTCGQAFAGPTRLNTLPGGQACPTCRDRLLESLPSLLPSDPEALEEEFVEEEAVASQAGVGEPRGPRPHLQAQKGPGRLLRGGGPAEPA
jgi:DNA-directed RNA polymerase subunit RPC12/RpoP